MSDARTPWLLAFAAALSGAVAIIAGAFGAHGAASPLAAEWLRTGGQYQLIHAVAVVAIGARAPRTGWLMLTGSWIFAGTLYAMALGGPRWLGAVTPIGGTLMILGWLLLAAQAWRRR